MRQNHLTRRCILVLLLLMTVLAGRAQEGLNVDKVFQHYGHSKGCKMVEMRNASLKGYSLMVYKSLVYKNLESVISPYLKADRRSARKIREVVEDGRLVSGYYMMAPLAKGVNRYILFSYPGGAKGAVIYIEGRLSPDDIMKLCYK